MIEFRLNVSSGVPTYLQLVHQVKQAIRLGLLQPGDQLPTVKEVVRALAINPNTVLKAYRELDLEGLVEGRRGQGTYLSHHLPTVTPGDFEELREELRRWLAKARELGLSEEDIAALLATTARREQIKEIA